MGIITPGHQEQALKYQPIALGYFIKSGYSPLFMQVGREIDEKKRARRKAYCTARVIRRALNGNIGRRVSLYYEKHLAEVKGSFPGIFTEARKAEFDAEYGVRAEKDTSHQTNTPAAKRQLTSMRVTIFPGAK